MSNIRLAELIISQLVGQGVREFCVGFGGQSSPFTKILLRSPELRIHLFADERSGAFFALGRAKATNRPVAVVTTSGTAAAETLPATIEAFYSGVPLVIVSGDKPRRNRGTGAPQCIEQVNILGTYVSESIDIAGDEPLSLSGRLNNRPLHINVCFNQPPVDAAIQAMPGDGREGAWLASKETPATERDIATLRNFLSGVRSPCVVLGALQREDRDAVCDFLLRLGVPVLAEGSSGLREDPRLADIRLKTAEGTLFNMRFPGKFDSLLRIGRVPSSPAWRRAARKRPEEMKMLSISDIPFSGSPRSELIVTSPRSLFRHEKALGKTFDIAAHSDLLAFDARVHEQMLQLFSEEPEAEQSLIHALSLQIPERSGVYLGNSLPVRQWDIASTLEDKKLECDVSRGANGIDGQVSTLFGYSEPGRETWGFLGDLTTLCDLGAPWILPTLRDRAIRLVVINNGGGRLFDQACNGDLELQGLHAQRFSKWAEFWNLPCHELRRIPEKLELETHAVIDLCCNHEATRRFWDKSDRILSH